MWFLIIILILAFSFVFALWGRVGFTDFKEFKKQPFAHRGLFGKGIPENSMLAFQNAVNNGYGAELDVHLTADGELIVIHDHSLLRTVGADLKVEDLTLNEIEKFNLENTEEKIPTLKEVLKLFENKYPLIIELKATKSNVDLLCGAVAKLLNEYKGVYCIESFDPRCVRWFKKNCPQVIRGQLSENYFKTKNCKLNFAVKLAMALLLTNFLTKPDFIAYRFRDRGFLSFWICTRLLKLQGVGWTLTKEEIKTSVKENIIPIFEDR